MATEYITKECFDKVRLALIQRDAELKALISGLGIQVVTAPLTSASPGVEGDVAYDSDNFYWWTASGWRRTTGTSF